MAGVFPVQGFGFLSNYNGAFVASSAFAAMQAIASTNANSIELAPRLFMQTRTSNDVVADPNKTESDANILQAMANAGALGLSVTLKPMVSALDGSLAYVLNPNDPAAFFASYKNQMVHMADIAEQAGVSMLVIGNELGKLSGPEYRSYWVDLIDSIRAVFQGEITYAAATDEAINVSFWDKVDVIGINAYPPLTTKTDPTVEEMVNAWNSMSTDDYWAKVMNHMSPVDFFHSLALQYDKQVFFTETGYRSVDGTNISPGGWADSTTQDVQEQHDAFNAFFQVWGSEGGSWFRGASIWNWDTNNKYSPIGYSPEGKPAQGLITEWYGGQHQPPGQTLTGSPSADLMDVGGGNDVLSGGLGNDTIKAGRGDDTITGGPDTIPKLTETSVTVTGYSPVVDGVGAQMQLLINGQQVGSTVEFHNATDASGFQTFTFTFPNPGSISSLDLAFINDFTSTNGDRNLYIKDITVNGEHLSVSDAVNTSSPGTWNLYHNRSIHYDMTGHQDLFFGSSTDNDNLEGGAGTDLINGGAGADVINGGADNDTLNGGAGADVIHGGANDDTLNSGAGIATATDQLYGDDGNDIIKASTGDTGALLDGAAGRDQLYGSWVANVMNGGDGNDYLSGSGGLDVIHGDAGDDQLKGGPAATRMYGDDGNDSLQGGTGNEFLYGGIGNDRLIGSGGNDYLAGGSGNDTFVFAAGSGKDTVADFQNTDGVQDRVQIDKAVFADFSALQSHMAEVGTSVMITVDANNTIEIQNTTLSQLHASDFLFV
ncbi:glycoside hydrolase family 113 [Bradyrhizobium valentinum]|uniref:glycoside hydrolase family 113 n=1 Tax=Bradyrhizobium valentinum TaxID=1518501 RepID=UPI00070DC1C0|nr:carbohydrate-binding domain-containing protein [Bradyrhizobium valentinum]KRR02995.1 calcium-binding protein [Bradyrhizobium valentinum]